MSLKPTTFYPNSCFICQGTNKLQRCSRCNMVSYCGRIHQKQHWPTHKNVCTVISAILKEEKVSHIYEKLRGVDLLTWIAEKKKIQSKVGLRLNEPLGFEAEFMFQCPRACFVCHDTRQELLKDCPICPFANFCKEHPSSPLHDKDCADLKYIYDLDKKYNVRNTSISQAIMETTFSMQARVKFIDNRQEHPTSMRDFLNHYVKHDGVSEEIKVVISSYFAVSLTVFNALQKLNHTGSEVTIHLNKNIPNDAHGTWETLLHLLPNLKTLTVVLTSEKESREGLIDLCPKCIRRKKKIYFICYQFSHGTYMRQFFYLKPDIFFAHSIQPPNDINNAEWHEFLKDLKDVNCALLITTRTEKFSRFLNQSIRNIFQESQICYDGFNEFGSLRLDLETDDISVMKLYQFLLVTKDPTTLLQASPKSCVKFDSKTKSTEVKEELAEKTVEKLLKFNASSCPICSAKTSVTCKRCKMIFYCGTDHQNEHQSQHKDVCKAILGMLNERKTPNLFDKLNTADPEYWLRIKIELMKKAKTRLGRELSDFEKQMFLLPKTCFICHESDLSVLKNCECGVSLCNIHKNDYKHEQLCKDFSVAFKLSMIKEPVCLQFPDTIKKNKFNSMESFIDSNFKENGKFSKLNIPRFQKIMLSNSYTRPLTLIYAIEKLGLSLNSSMVVHVIGATGVEIGSYKPWYSVLSWLQPLNLLKIVFIGPKVLNASPDLPDDFGKVEAKNPIIETEFQALQYEEYFQSKYFIQPDIVIGYNLNLHERELGISEFTLTDTILTLTKVKAPFVFTIESAERIQKDCNSLCNILKKCVNYLHCKLNPFAGLIPERDFETEELLYSNQFVLFYDGLCEKSEELKKEDEQISEKSPNVEVSQMEDKECEAELKKVPNTPENLNNRPGPSSDDNESLGIKETDNRVLKQILLIKEEIKELKSSVLCINQDGKARNSHECDSQLKKERGTSENSTGKKPGPSSEDKESEIKEEDDAVWKELSLLAKEVKELKSAVRDMK